MGFLKLSRRACALAGAFLLCAGSASAAPTYTGTFGTDDDRFVFDFNVAGPATLTAFTSSYALGGFAPVLTLFGGAGGYQQALGSANVCPGAGGGGEFCWDAMFASTLQAGSYTLVLTQDGNVALGDTLADGFSLDGWTDYTSQMYAGVAGGSCINVDASQRTCDFALTVDIVPDQADAGGAVPEPGSLALCGAALLVAAARRRHLRRR
jgi:hypothetical protein